MFSTNDEFSANFCSPVEAERYSASIELLLLFFSEMNVSVVRRARFFRRRYAAFRSPRSIVLTLT